MLVSDVMSVMQELAPLHYAAEWDNVGLLIGSRSWRAERILLTIDLTENVLDEAVRGQANMIIAYHPPIFNAFKRLTDDSTAQRIALKTAQANISVYSPHTALDAAPGGVNDWLAEGLGNGDSRALEPLGALPESQQCKIVTFCPSEAVDNIRNGLASIGAGRIGAYQLCSFEIPGTGTFLGGEETKPAIGSKGVLQRVDEIRLEMVCPKAALGLAVVTLREFHPYEEPPIEIYELHARPMRNAGQGRRVVLDQPVGIKTLADRIKHRTSMRKLWVAKGNDAPEKYARIGICAGAGGSLLPAALDQGCQLFLTGEMRHHDILWAQSRGCSVMLAGHTNTERGYLEVLKKKLDEKLPGAAITVSKRDADPLKAV